MLKNQKGFTLVEVIVVAVIVAVLAAVAIPLYMGYIRDSRIDVGNNVGGTLASAAGATTQQGLTVPAGVASAKTGDPNFVVFPSIGNDANHPNHVIIPNGFTSVIANSKASCYYTDYDASSCKQYKFAK